MKLKFYKEKSYTLIEIIVVIAIIAIISGIGLAYYNQFTEEKKLEAEVEKFVDVLNLARQKAISGQVDSACDLYIPNLSLVPPDPPKAFGGYRVRFTDAAPISNPSEIYQLRICCTNPCFVRSPWNHVRDVSSYRLTSNIKLKWHTSAIATFIPLYGKMDDNADRTVTFKNITLNKCIQVTINASGIISTAKDDSCSTY